MIDSKLGPKNAQTFSPFIKFSSKFLTPNQLTIGAVILGISAGISFYFLDNPIIPISLLLLSGLFDILDGSVARYTGKSSLEGAFLDLTLDRTVESSMVIAWTLKYLSYFSEVPIWQSGIFAGVIFLGLATYNITTFLAASNIFPNTGHKSFHYDIGIVERTETFILYFIMIVFSAPIGLIGLWIFNILMLFTAVERSRRVVNFLKQK